MEFVLRTDRRDGVTVLKLSNAPLNCLSKETRRQLADALQAVELDSTVTAVVLMGNGRAFSTGADLKEFDRPDAFTDRDLQHLIFAQIESMTKPVVAAIHGVALGGGCELALGCHYRVAAPDAKIGLPEITLGFMPGAGGTQRLPRAIGLEPALNLILKGDSVSGGEGLRLGLVDAVIHEDVEQGAIAFALRVATLRPLPLLRDKPIVHPNAVGFLDFVRRTVKADPHAPPGASSVVEALAAAATLALDKGLEIEFDLFRRLAESAEAKAFRHIFFATRAAGRVPTSARRMPALATALVVGGGAMGRGITVSLLDAGLAVSLLESDGAAREVAASWMRDHYRRQVEQRRLSPERMEQTLSRFACVQCYEEAHDVDLAIEAVFEDMDVKLDVMSALDRATRPEAILATNTSSLDVNQLAAATTRPQQVLGLHFFNPAQVMKLVEVVRADKTAPEVLEAAIALVRRMRKIAVISGVCDGFIGNRMMTQYLNQAMFILEEGTMPWVVDDALEKWGMAMGPFRMLDLVGNEVPWEARKRKYLAHPHGVYPRVADELCERGWYGQKTGRGWYVHEQGRRQPKPNPDAAALIESHALKHGIPKREVAPDEIVERCIYALVNEGSAVLGEGIAGKASDIDVLLTTGYGFPRTRGGPMFHAEAVGLANVLRRMRRFAATGHGDREFWNPDPLLVRLANSGKAFVEAGDRR